MAVYKNIAADNPGCFPRFGIHLFATKVPGSLRMNLSLKMYHKLLSISFTDRSMFDKNRINKRQLDRIARRNCRSARHTVRRRQIFVGNKNTGNLSIQSAQGKLLLLIICRKLGFSGNNTFKSKSFSALFYIMDFAGTIYYTNLASKYIVCDRCYMPRYS